MLIVVEKARGNYMDFDEDVNAVDFYAVILDYRSIKNKKLQLNK